MVKKRLQLLGSATVRRFSNTSVPDVTSGFRAYNREAALRVQVVSKFTYALETIIQAGKMLVAVDSVPIGTNPKTRESRLFSSTWVYVRRNTLAILRVYTMYEPLRVFMIAAGAVALVGAAIWIRFIYYFVDGPRQRPRAVTDPRCDDARIAVQLAALGVMADVLAAIRVLMQRSLERIQRVELQLGVEPSHYESADEGKEPAVHAQPASARARLLAPARRLRCELVAEALDQFAAGAPSAFSTRAAAMAPSLSSSRIVIRAGPSSARISATTCSSVDARRGARADRQRRVRPRRPDEGSRHRGVRRRGRDRVPGGDPGGHRSVAADDRSAPARRLLVAHVPEREWKPIFARSEATWRHEVRHGYDPAELATRLAEPRPRGVQVDRAPAAASSGSRRSYETACPPGDPPCAPPSPSRSSARCGSSGEA